MNKLCVTLIADDPLARAGLASLLAGQDDCRVVDQFDSSPAQLDLVDPGAQDVFLWDLGWDAEIGLAALAEMEDLGAPVLLLVPGAESARTRWQTGTGGILLRTANPSQLMAGLRAVAAGLTVWDSSLAASFLPQDPPTELILDPLTPRELEVLHLLAEGLPNKAIARRLAISDHTVKFHVNALLGKLQAQSRTEAVIRASRAGLVVL